MPTDCDCNGQRNILMAEDVRFGQGHARIVVEAGAAERGWGDGRQLDSRISMLFMPAVPLLKIFLQPLMESWSGSPTAAAGGANVALTWKERQVRKGQEKESEDRNLNVTLMPRPAVHPPNSLNSQSSLLLASSLLLSTYPLWPARSIHPLPRQGRTGQDRTGQAGRQAGSATLYFRLVLFEDRFIVVVFLVVV